MISTRTIDGVETVTHDDGVWRFERVGRWATFTATHAPTGTVIETGATGYDDAKRVARTQRPDLFAEAKPTSSYTVARGRQSAARPGVRRTQ